MSRAPSGHSDRLIKCTLMSPTERYGAPLEAECAGADHDGDSESMNCVARQVWEGRVSGSGTSRQRCASGKRVNTSAIRSSIRAADGP